MPGGTFFEKSEKRCLQEKSQHIYNATSAQRSGPNGPELTAGKE